jgi:hypothetical protein
MKSRKIMFSLVLVGILGSGCGLITGLDPLLPGHTYRLEMVVNPGKDSEKAYHWMFTR